MALDREQLIGELRLLRQGRGLTISALEPHNELRELFGLVELEGQYDQLVNAVKQLGDDERAMALQNAFNIGPGLPATLTDRRSAFASARKISERTVINWEDAMLGELADQILNRTDYLGPLETVTLHVDIAGLQVKALWYTYTFEAAGALAPNAVIHRNPKANWNMVPVFVKWPNLKQLSVELHFVEGPTPTTLYETIYETLEDWVVNRSQSVKSWTPAEEYGRADIAFPSFEHYYLFSW